MATLQVLLGIKIEKGEPGRIANLQYYMNVIYYGTVVLLPLSYFTESQPPPPQEEQKKPTKQEPKDEPMKEDISQEKQDVCSC